MSDYYDLLGIEPGADKEAIRAAYREQLDGASQSDRAKLNKAWNVLSDPVQRGRYDDARDQGWLDDADDADDDETDDAPAPARTRAGRASASGRPRPPARAPLVPTLELPEAVAFAEPRARNMALLTDVIVLILIFVGTNFAGVAIINNQYPEETDAISRYVKIVDKADEAESKANDAKSKADDAIKAEKAKNNPDQAAIDAETKKSDSAAVTAKAAEVRSKNFQDRIVDEQKNLQGAYLLMLGAILVLCLAYTVPMTALTGQTLGKRFQHIRVARVDGSPVGWGGAFAHYALPLVVAIGLQGVLGPLSFLVGLGMVLWSLRDRNRQGIHDRLAKTIVVADG